MEFLGQMDSFQLKLVHWVGSLTIFLLLLGAPGESRSVYLLGTMMPFWQLSRIRAMWGHTIRRSEPQPAVPEAPRLEAAQHLRAGRPKRLTQPSPHPASGQWLPKAIWSFSFLDFSCLVDQKPVTFLALSHCFFLFGWEGSPTKTDYRKTWTFSLGGSPFILA